ncbi:hypothetical protein ASPBRDRAFT_200828 [Aspergillus brasiliensis CBS 101740]|uniref:Uncharacterized protein n=1 Tax=Aspergillus brasiliensis (strain CBS 101740 / IMI 381727 / IBT 21946) TaxID=767769 RepID=A0A1L9U4E1_ASPBC|nr:hypothetical protein ASPBRDRAFT_200828 [Aspergillus brasiliensis CBS 101740]
MGFTIFQNRGNVGMSRMTEVMVNILPACMGSDAKGMPPSSRHDYLGDRSNWMYLTPMPSSSGILERRMVSHVIPAGWQAGMGFTVDSNRGNVGMSQMSEVLINILPAYIGSDAKGMPPTSQHDRLGESEKNVVTCTSPIEEEFFEGAEAVEGFCGMMNTP